ncbi:MAG: N-acetylmuramoyl-L-alanine amidase [Bdellovibrionales bacterium]
MKFAASPNFGPRAEGKEIKYVIIHYTAMESAPEALARLCDPAAEVSAHYLIDKQGEITQMVDERLRAWHAGQSEWEGETDINSCSIGIELDNKGNEPYPPLQIEALKTLLEEIKSRHNIGSNAILGHSDIAPTRKQDPGPLFPWEEIRG